MPTLWKKFRLATGVVLSLVASMNLAKAGGSDSGGGGDSKNMDNGAMWFTGAAKTVEVCFVSSLEKKTDKKGDKERNENLNEFLVRASIVRASKLWADYFSRHVAKGRGRIVYSNPKNSPSFNFEFSSSCTASTDLSFYLGHETPEVRLVKSNYDNPIAFAHRQSYGKSRGWGRGFVWIAPKIFGSAWTQGTLDILLLHELGHIFGCEHVDGTIMTEKIIDLLRLYTMSGDAQIKEKLFHIDINRELLNHGSLNESIPGYVEIVGLAKLGVSAVPLNGSIKAEVIKRGVQAYELIINGLSTMKIKTYPNPTEINGNEALFKIYLNGEPNSADLVYYFAVPGATIEYGTLEKPDGGVLPIILERNLILNGPRVRIRIFSDSGIQPLYQSFHVII